VSTETLLSFARGLESDEPTWHVAVRTIADEIGDTADPKVLVDEARRLWRAHPNRRGVLLYLLGHVAQRDERALSAESFAKLFDAPASRAEFEQMLAEGTSAVWLAPELWPALSGGWSKFVALSPKLDVACDKIPPGRSSAYGLLSRLKNRVCEEGAVTDAVALHAWLVERVGSHPGEGFAELRDETENGKCALRGTHAGSPVPKSDDAPKRRGRR
jgi:hypothetical protein